MYKVINDFRDSQDNYHFYKSGDIFPRKGVEVSDERIKALSTKNNRCNMVFIKYETDNKLVEESKSEDIVFTKTEIMRLKKDELLDVAKKIGMQDIDELSGTKLKELLINHYGL